MFYRESEEELLQEFPDFYDDPPIKESNNFYENEQNLDESQSLLYEGGDNFDVNSKYTQPRPDFKSDYPTIRRKKEDDGDPSPVQGDNNEERQVRPRMSYHFMDGIRGYGAFAVYLCHFMIEYFPPQTEKQRDAGIDVVAAPKYLAYPPFAVLYNGYLWVKVFFILSGFVLPLNFFKTGRNSCITGGVMRRYFRLMIPVLMILSIYVLFARLDCFGESTFNKIKNKTFLNLLYVSMIEIWAGPSISFIEPTWTLGIEFWATYLVYIVAFTGHTYRGRFFFYAALIWFFWSIEYLGFLNLIPWKAGKAHVQIPYFLIGMALSDMENMVERPLDKIRDLHWGWKIPVNGLLLAIIFIWGSVSSESPKGCQTNYDDRCYVYTVATLNGFIPKHVTVAFAAIAINLLALTSDVMQWLLNSAVGQFLGQCSYTLYLLHILFVHWVQRDTYNYMLGEAVEPDEAITYIFLIYTPILFFFSWILEIIVDRPAKDFAGEFDRQTRRVRPKPQPIINEETGEKDTPNMEEYYSCSAFSKRIWPIWAFIAWLLTLAIVVEIFNANHTYKPINQKNEHNTGEVTSGANFNNVGELPT